MNVQGLRSWTGAVTNRARGFFSNKEVQRTLLVFALFTVCMTASADATAIAGQMKTRATPWIILGLRIFGGCLSISGLVVSILGFVGRDEGFDKVTKIGVGILMIAIGVYMLASPDSIMTNLSLDKLFETT